MRRSSPTSPASLCATTCRLLCVCGRAQANRFARDTGHTVALFAVGGVLAGDAPDTADLSQDLVLADVKAKDNSIVQPGLKVAVLKYGSGGVARQLVTRGEIVKFVSARGSKALGEMHANAHQADASA